MDLTDSTFCRYASQHEPGEICEHCNLEVDKYGNTEGDFLYCSFPNCGCDGARLCMAGEASADAKVCNVEGMYSRGDDVAREAKLKLLDLVYRKDSNK